MNGLQIVKLEVGMLGTNCYLVRDERTGKGYVIDPGGEGRTILEAASRVDLSSLGILCTHGHMDHVGAVGKVAEDTGSPVYISREDSGILAGAGGGITIRLSSLLVSKPSGVEFLGGGDTLPLGEFTISVLDTPGHTKGSLSFLVGENLFCGDLIFKGSIGRTDLKGGSLPDLIEAVRKHVWVLPDDTRIYPGHGPATTVGWEKRTNQYLSKIPEEI